MTEPIKIVLATGGFDPIHSGHLNYLRAAKQLGAELIVGVNSEDWLIRKKGEFFLPTSERVQIIGSLKWVDRVITFNDDDRSSNNAIRWCLRYIKDVMPILYGHQEYVIVFANGGDRTTGNIPEIERYGSDDRVSFEFNVGGKKTNSSIQILSRWDKRLYDGGL